MNKGSLAVVTLVALALAAGGGYWLGTQRGGPTQAAQAPAASGATGTAAGRAAQGQAPAVTVEATKVVTVAWPQTISAVGSLRSDESVTLRPEVAGRIAAIGFAEGQKVTKGATLVRLDPAINEAEVQQARANLKLAQSKYDRAVDLAKSNFISGQARDEAENNLRVAQAALRLTEAKLAKMEIKAPFSGVIGLRSVSVGDYVKEGADMVNLEAIDPLKVDFRVPEVYLSEVAVGQSLNVALDALPGRTYEGRVLAVNPLVDSAGRAIVIRAQVRNGDTQLRPGMFARVALITRSARNALVVPEQAIVPQGEDQYVFKVVDGKAERVKVEVGLRREGKVEVVKGVAAGDVVVSAGQLKLRDGVRVAIVPAGPGNPGAAAQGGAPAGAAAQGGAPAGAAAQGGAPAGAAAQGSPVEAPAAAGTMPRSHGEADVRRAAQARSAPRS